jgi:hypothetical protein
VACGRRDGEIVSAKISFGAVSASSAGFFFVDFDEAADFKDIEYFGADEIASGETISDITGDVSGNGMTANDITGLAIDVQDSGDVLSDGHQH